MLNKLEGWLLNVFLGKLVARAAVSIVAFAGGSLFQGIAKKAGIVVSIDPVELQAGLMLGAHAAYEWFKARRMKNPESPAVQTDPSLTPGTVIVTPRPV